MQKLSFIKGLVFGTLFSAFFWIGAYQAVTNFTDNESSTEQNIQVSEINEVRASF